MELIDFKLGAFFYDPSPGYSLRDIGTAFCRFEWVETKTTKSSGGAILGFVGHDSIENVAGNYRLIWKMNTPVEIQL